MSVLRPRCTSRALASLLAAAAMLTVPAAASAQEVVVPPPSGLPPQEPAPPVAPPPQADRELPGGGTRMLPERRVVAFYGHAGRPRLGALGRGTPEGSATRVQTAAQDFAAFDRPVLPAFNLVAVVATATPGRDGRYRRRVPDAVIARHLAAIRRVGGILVLDVQPGRSTFLDEARALEPWLREPDVSLGLDPEWNVGRRGRPGRGVVGSVTAAHVNAVGRQLDALAARERLPQKLLLVHQFRPSMVRFKEQLVQHPRVAVTMSMDGIGTSRAKRLAYERFAAQTPTLNNAFMVFLRRDTEVLPAERVFGLAPAPDVVIYQ